MNRILFVTLLIFAHYSHSLDLLGEEESLNQDEKVFQMAKERTYPGGEDEESLEVQKDMKYPVKTVDLFQLQRQILEANENELKKEEENRAALGEGVEEGVETPAPPSQDDVNGDPPDPADGT